MNCKCYWSNTKYNTPDFWLIGLDWIGLDWIGWFELDWVAHSCFSIWSTANVRLDLSVWIFILWFQMSLVSCVANYSSNLRSFNLFNWCWLNHSVHHSFTIHQINTYMITCKHLIGYCLLACKLGRPECPDATYCADSKMCLPFGFCSNDRDCYGEYWRRFDWSTVDGIAMTAITMSNAQSNLFLLLLHHHLLHLPFWYSPTQSKWQTALPWTSSLYERRVLLQLRLVMQLWKLLWFSSLFGAREP